MHLCSFCIWEYARETGTVKSVWKKKELTYWVLMLSHTHWLSVFFSFISKNTGHLFQCSEIKGLKMYFYVSMYMYYSMHGYLQRPEEFVGSPGIRAMEGCTISWVLETEPGSSSRATSALNCLIISPFPRINFLNVYFFFFFSLVTQGLTLRVRLASKTCSCLPFLDFHVLVL